MIQNIQLPTVMVIALMCCAPLAQAETLYEKQVLFSEPSVQSEAVGSAEKGEVSVLDRRGFWVKIQSGEKIGWTKLSNVKMHEEIIWMDPIDTLRDTGRLGREQ